MKKIISIAVLLVLLTGCGAQSTNVDKLNIVTTYYPYQLAASQIGGDYVNVSSIFPPDSEAHSYELTPKQSIEIQDADLVIITNPEEDSKIYNILEDRNNLLILDPDNNAGAQNDHSHSHEWMSPLEMIDSVNTITNSLEDLDPTNKLTYQANGGSLTSKLQTINEEYTTFGQEQTKPIIATHDAYESLTDDYGIEFSTLYGAHHDDEPTTKEILDTVDLINKQDINTIFVEQDDISNKVMHQIADEASVDVETMYTLETQSTLKDFKSVTDFYEYNLEMMKLGQE